MEAEMKLLLNATSPYARVVRIAALEKGLGDRLEVILVDPWASNASLLAHTPVSKVPVLITDSGVELVESQLILAYLDRFVSDFQLFPAQDLERVLHLAGLGQGLIDASFNTVIARKHEGDRADIGYVGSRRLAVIQRVLPRIADELERGQFPPFSAAHIVLGVALEYLSFRLPEFGWESHYPQLAEWRDDLIQRPGFLQTSFA